MLSVVHTFVVDGMRTNVCVYNIRCTVAYLRAKKSPSNSFYPARRHCFLNSILASRYCDSHVRLPVLHQLISENCRCYAAMFNPKAIEDLQVMVSLGRLDSIR